MFWLTHALDRWLENGTRVVEMEYREYIVPLHIAADAYRRLYSGDAQHVLARDQEGRKIQFPASSLRPFVTREGIRGTFIIRVDAQNKLTGIPRMEETS